MISVSSAFLAAIRRSHRVEILVDITLNGFPVAQNLRVADGEVRMDAKQAIRRTCSLRLADPDLWPADANDPLAPYGQEAIVKYVVHTASTAETVQLGVFVVRSVNWDEPTGTLVIQGSDRTSRLTEAFGLPTAWVYYDKTSAVLTESLSTGTVDLRAFINLLITHRAGPGVSVSYSTRLPVWGRTRSPKGLVAEDRWETGIKLAAQLLGGECWATNTGDFAVAPPPDVATTPVWSVDCGATGVLVGARRGLTREGVYNLITVRSQRTDSSAWATVYDNNPDSPTYPGLYTGIAGRAADVTTGAYTGEQTAYGEVHKVIDSAVSTSTEDCEHEARIWLRAQLGLLRSVDLTAVPNPALEAGDVIAVIYHDGTTEKHIIDSLVIPLGPGRQYTATTRTSTYNLPDA